VGPRAVLDTVVKRQIPSPRRESNPRTPIVSTKIVYFPPPHECYMSRLSHLHTLSHLNKNTSAVKYNTCYNIDSMEINIFNVCVFEKRNNRVNEVGYTCNKDLLCTSSVLLYAKI
jgi:hypothetical protein